jgi:hypothetical protein
MKRFFAFCERYQVINPFPVTEQILCSYAAFLADEGLSPQTGKTYMVAVRNMQISLGLPDPRQQSSFPVLKRVQAGISRSRLLKGAPPRIRLPITAQLLRQMRQSWERSSNPEKLVLWAVSCTAFFGFFRLGELLLDSPTAFNPTLHLAWGDVAVDDPSEPKMVKIHLKQSKTDQFGKGSDIFLGRTNNELCLVSAMLNFLVACKGSQGPLFIDSRSRPVTKAHFVAELHLVLGLLGIPQDHYAGHSFWIGAATSAALAGVEDSTIQMLGQWHSSAYLRYVRTPPNQLAALSVTLASLKH